ncbi:hypothetical protein Lalb_Chr21g0311421 [Lupinus albus]|uniref:Uncharacterized protein n=1 Tax=Lupinus albus TaxID=3870 RepID=A0A6A4NQI7_LUPAL|nr:hypothetical protein Lalb_Chr21g0311421 [Lupinus albus]
MHFPDPIPSDGYQPDLQLFIETTLHPFLKSTTLNPTPEGLVLCKWQASNTVRRKIYVGLHAIPYHRLEVANTTFINKWVPLTKPPIV